jgi:hypothetical protein
LILMAEKKAAKKTTKPQMGDVDYWEKLNGRD